MKKILMGIVTFFSVSAFASNFYVQSDILVSGEGKSVLEAQTNAVSEGQKKAFLMLLKKIAPTVDITQFETVDVAPLVQDVSLSDEKVSATTYKGNLSVRFKSEPIYELLAGQNEPFLTSLPEAMLETYENMESKDSVSEKINKWLAWADVVVIGCGLGKDDAAYHILAAVIDNCNRPLVCDADALQLLAAHQELCKSLYEKNKKTGRKVVFTPHPGELASLLHCSIADIKAARINMAKKTCEEYGVILIAKDADTMCVNVSDAVYLNTSGNDGLSTAGSGDVLAGLTASIIAQSLRSGMSIFEAVCLSVFLHGYTADYLAKKIGKRFLVASDIIEAYKYILE